MERYLLQPSENNGWWLVTEMKYKISVLFKEHEFTTKKYASILDDPNAAESDIRRLLRSTKDLNNYMRASLAHIAF